MRLCRPARGQPTDPGLKYQTAQLSPEALHSGELATIHFRYKLPGEASSQLYTQPIPAQDADPVETATDNFRFAAAVAQWGMLLRNSEHKFNASYDNVLQLAQSARDPEEFGCRAEFLQLVRTSKSLAKTRP